MKTALRLVLTSASGLFAFFLLLAATPLVRADASDPMIQVGGGAQSAQGEGMRAILRVTYAGTSDRNPGCTMQASCLGRFCDTRFYLVEGTVGVGLSGQSILASADVKFTLMQDYQEAVRNIRQWNALPARLRRDVSLGNEGKLQIDLLGFAYRASSRDLQETGPGLEAFFAASVSAVGAQALIATEAGSRALTQAYAGLDIGQASAEAGVTQHWAESFATRITVGGRADLGLVFNGNGARISSERSAFARFSAILGKRQHAIEAFVQGDAGQMQVGTDSREYVSLQAGALTRF